MNVKCQTKMIEKPVKTAHAVFPWSVNEEWMTGANGNEENYSYVIKPLSMDKTADQTRD